MDEAQSHYADWKKDKVHAMLFHLCKIYENNLYNYSDRKISDCLRMGGFEWQIGMD